jgi:hypothetical protein
MVSACDPCAVYNASRSLWESNRSVTFSLSEQYTDFQRRSGTPENSVRDGEFIRSFSTTQASLAYRISESLNLQAHVPLIARRSDTISRYRVSTETDTGLGDVVVASSYALVQRKSPEWSIFVETTGGVKLPTGETGELEELSQISKTPPMTSGTVFSKHHPVGSASGGRAFTFGSGSYDYIAGLVGYARFQRYVLGSQTQYSYRTTGDFHYDFGDEFLWSINGGYYVLLEHSYTVAALVTLSTEFKDSDTLRNRRVGGSGLSNSYLGPQLIFTFNDNLGAEISVDFRTSDEDSQATVVPKSRVRAAVSYRFS